jgi:hypothetical protein
LFIDQFGELRWAKALYCKARKEIAKTAEVRSYRGIRFRGTRPAFGSHHATLAEKNMAALGLREPPSDFTPAPGAARDLPVFSAKISFELLALSFSRV